MPCYTIRRVSVELQAANKEMLIQGLKAAGFNVREVSGYIDVSIPSKERAGRTLSGRIVDGQISFQDGDAEIVNRVKQAYAGEAVRRASKQYGWDLRADGNKQEQGFVARRRF
jgi:hypothetical protein